MNDIRNCPRCGKVFAYVGHKICAHCIKIDESEFEKVKEFLYDYPRSSPIVVSNETGVELKKIMRFLKEERIEIAPDIDDAQCFLVCESCGSPIHTGRLCNHCKIRLGNDLQSMSYEDIKYENELERHFQKDMMFTANRRIS